MKADLLDAPSSLAPATRSRAGAKLRRVYHEREAPAWSVLAGRLGFALGAIALWGWNRHWRRRGSRPRQRSGAFICVPG